MPQTIRDVRLVRGVSQARLALLLGISQRHLSRFELGQASVGEQRTREVLRAIEIAATLPRSPRRTHKRTSLVTGAHTADSFRFAKARRNKNSTFVKILTMPNKTGPTSGSLNAGTYH